MHIPSTDTAVLTLTPFDEALAAALEPSAEYDVNRWLYVPNCYADYRYLLGTRGSRPLICVGINPSTAAPDHLDNTLKSVERIAHGNGYDSFLMFNVYAQRATRPNDMEKTCNGLLHRENMRAFDFALSLSEKPAVWAAWGTIITRRPYLIDCVRDMVEIAAGHGACWYTAGARSKQGGHPHHPLYLRRDSRLERFDAQAYCRTLS